MDEEHISNAFEFLKKNCKIMTYESMSKYTVNELFVIWENFVYELAFNVN